MDGGATSMKWKRLGLGSKVSLQSHFQFLVFGVWRCLLDTGGVNNRCKLKERERGPS